MGITLGILEDQLRHLEGLILKGEQRNLFSLISDDIKPEAKQDLRRRIERLLDLIAGLKDYFDLHQSQKEFLLSAVVQSTVLFLQIEVENAMSARMKGYGPVDRKVKDTLDPKLKEMISVLNEINAIVNCNGTK